VSEGKSEHQGASSSVANSPGSTAVRQRSESEKHEKRARNKDRLDHGVWSPLHCSDVQKASEERLTPSVLQSAQAYHNPSEGINASAHEYL
ncbi:hypothetical protein Goarm_023281, partial [Gossypium armourianum]|nr:hypothetical protein [Gossypium armourianum]